MVGTRPMTLPELLAEASGAGGAGGASEASASRTSLTFWTTFTGGAESIDFSRFSRSCATALTLRAGLRLTRFARRSADILDVCARR